MKKEIRFNVYSLKEMDRLIPKIFVPLEKVGNLFSPYPYVVYQKK